MKRSVLGIAALGAAAATFVASPALGGDGPGRPVQEVVVGPGLTGGGSPDRTTGQLSLGIDTSVLQARVTGSCSSGEALVAVNADGSVVCGTPGAGTWILDGTEPQDASFAVSGSGAIGSGLAPSATKLRVAGGAWNPDDSDGDVLIGDSLYRLKIGVATSGGGAGDVRIRAQGGSNRLVLGGGSSDTMVVGETGVGIGTGSPAAPLEVAGSASSAKLRVSGGNWNVTGSDGDVVIGDALHRLKIGVATSGGGAGDVRVRAQGGTDRLILGGGGSDTMIVGENGVHVAGTLTKTYGTSTAPANAAPIAYGTVSSSGARLTGTAGWTSTYDAALDAYRITITGHPATFADVATVTPIAPVAAVATTHRSGGDLLVFLHDLTGADVQLSFSFVVHRT